MPRIVEKVFNDAMNRLEKDPAGKASNALDWLNRFALLDDHKQQISVVRNAMDKDTNWRDLYVNSMRELNPEVRNRVAYNFLFNAGLRSIPKQRKLAEKMGHDIPWAILFDPTDRCNLKCTGCWAGEYARSNDLEYDLLERIVSEGEKLHIHFYVVSGGEPLLRRDDLLTLAKNHRNSIFHVFTNSTLITEKFAAECVEAGNIVFAISVDGFETATDARRGKGVFRRIMAASTILRDHGIPFGFSTTYDRNNVDEVFSDAFVDMLIARGFLYGWYFTYMPVGIDPNVELMATPEQRAFAYDRVQTFRKTKAAFIADFWNDGEATDGCIAGGRKYFHINAAGDIEPCAFIHYASGNIRDMSVKEALSSPLFMAYQKRQPFNENMLRPCPLIDNPVSLVECLEESAAYCTQCNKVDPAQLADRLKVYEARWGKIAESIWTKG
ncbi:MAG: radical SAM protein [Ignavibacteriales bacterium]